MHPHICHVTNCHRKWRAGFLLSQLGDHGARKLDPFYGETACRQRQRDATRADRKFEDLAATGQFRQQLNSLFHQYGVRPAMVFVVGCGDVVIKIPIVMRHV